MVTSVNQSDFIKTALRLPKDLHAQLHAEAQETGRSYNAEIVARLQKSFENEPGDELTHPRLETALQKLRDEMKLLAKTQQQLVDLQSPKGDTAIDVTAHGKNRTLEIGPDGVKEKSHSKK